MLFYVKWDVTTFSSIFAFFALFYLDMQRSFWLYFFQYNKNNKPLLLELGNILKKTQNRLSRNPLISCDLTILFINTDWFKICLNIT